MASSGGWPSSWCPCYKTFLLHQRRPHKSSTICPWKAFPSWSNFCRWGQELHTDRFRVYSPILDQTGKVWQEMRSSSFWPLHEWRGKSFITLTTGSLPPCFGWDSFE
jgi:hypothetical protein